MFIFKFDILYFDKSKPKHFFCVCEWGGGGGGGGGGGWGGGFN